MCLLAKNPPIQALKLAERVNAEMRSAARADKGQTENGDVSGALSSNASPTIHSVHLADEVACMPSASSSVDTDKGAAPSNIARLLGIGKAIEQAVHKWLYRHTYLKLEVARVREMVEEANGQLIALRTVQERIQLGMEHLGPELRREIQRSADDCVRRFVEIEADFTSIVSGLEARTSVLGRSVTVVEGDMAFQRRRFARLADACPYATDIRPMGSVGLQAPPRGDGAVDALYVAFENRFRGAPDEIKQRIRPYVDRLRIRRPAVPGKPLLDIGCGRGEWLELLSEAGIEAYGIDSNPHVIAACERRGLSAHHVDALAHFAELPDGTLGAISMFHVIEHVPTEALLHILEEARRTLIPGGLLMLETPNPESIKVGASTFYTDPTHLRPIPPQVAEFLVERCGFGNIETLRLNPYPETAIIREDTEAARRLNELMYGPQDYAILAHRL